MSRAKKRGNGPCRITIGAEIGRKSSMIRSTISTSAAVSSAAFLREFRGAVDRLIGTIDRKNADYSRSKDDALRNFKVVEWLTQGRVTAMDGLLSRMSDKLIRVANLTAPQARAKV